MVNQKDKVQGKVQKGIYLLMNGAVTFVCTDSRVVGVMSNFPESCFSRSEVGRHRRRSDGGADYLCLRFLQSTS